MTLSTRESRFIKTGAILLAVLVVYFLILNPLRLKWAEGKRVRETRKQSFVALKEQVKTKTGLDRQMADLQKKLKVTVPESSPSDQIHEFMKKLEETAQKSQAKIKNVLPRRDASQRTGSVLKPGSRAAFSMNFDTSQPNLVNFLRSLQELDRPVVVTSLNVTANEKNPSELKVTMQFYTYVFNGKKQ